MRASIHAPETAEAVASAARGFLRVYDEFDGDPACVGEYLDALIDAMDKLGD